MNTTREVDITTFEAVVNVYRTATEEIKRWTKIRDDCNKSLKEAVGEGVGVVKGVPAINVQRVSARRFDSKTFVDEFPELAEKYMTETTTFRLTIVDNDNDKDND